MTVLSSSLVQYYQLVKKFMADIITGVYTELLDSDDKTVSRSMINHIIAKRKYTWMNLNNEKDVRLKNLDIMAMIDRRQKFHKPFSEYRSASFLAKKRRMGWQAPESIDKEQKEIQKIIEIDSGSESDDSDRGENSSDNSDDNDNDDMLKPFDQEDELAGQYITQDDKRQHLFEDAHVKLYDTIDTF
jgi:Mg-chelatase subunit ChlI